MYPKELQHAPGGLVLEGSIALVVSTAQAGHLGRGKQGVRDQSWGLSVSWKTEAAPWHVEAAGCTPIQGCHWSFLKGVGRSL